MYKESSKKGQKVHLHFVPHWLNVDLWTTGIMLWPQLLLPPCWPAKEQYTSSRQTLDFWLSFQICDGPNLANKYVQMSGLREMHRHLSLQKRIVKTPLLHRHIRKTLIWVEGSLRWENSPLALAQVNCTSSWHKLCWQHKESTWKETTFAAPAFDCQTWKDTDTLNSKIGT